MVWLGIVVVSTVFGVISLLVLAALRLDVCAVEPCFPAQFSPETARKYTDNGVPFAVIALLRPVLEIITAMTYMVVGIVIFRRRSDDWMGLLTSLMLCLLGFRLTGFTGIMPQVFPETRPMGLALTSLMFISAYLTLYLFPNGRLYPRWAVVPLVITLAYELLRGVALYVPIFGTDVASQLPFGGILLGSIGLYCQIRRYNTISPIERQQLKWVILAVALLLGGLFTNTVSNIAVPILEGSAYVVISLLAAVAQYALFLGLPLAFAFSMLRYRLCDADLVINRALVYAALSITLSVLFFTLFFVLQAGLKGLSTDSTLPLIISTGVVAALFNPARAQLARFVDKQIYGFRVELRDIRNRPAHDTRFMSANQAVSGPQTGKLIGGYRLAGLLGKGGMGEVYAAQHSETEAIAAIKLLPPEMAAQAEPLARFEREADLLSRLSHPNIVRTMGAGLSDSFHYLAMELIDGLTLSERMKQSPALSRQEAIALIRDIAAGLDAAHAAGVIHRDVKPSNVLLRPTVEGVQAVLTDFGIAKLAQDATSSLARSNLVGTLDYIAPEQIIASRAVDHRADIYALGMIAYQLLVGQHPFVGMPAAGLLFAHLHQPPPEPRDLRPDLSRPMA